MADPQQNRKRVAIIGSGMAGLSAAWLLGEDSRFEVSLYETHSEPGLGAHSVELDLNGKKAVVDVPLRIVTCEYYPELLSMYKHLGVDLYTADSSTSWSILGGSTFFRYFNLMWQTFTIPMASGRFFFSRDFFKITRDLFYFCKAASEDYHRGVCKDVSIGDYLRDNGYSDAFTHLFMVPLFAAICTCSDHTVLSYPAEVIIEYFVPIVTSPMGVKRVSEGVKMVGKLLTANTKHLYCNTAVTKLEKLNGSGLLQVTDDSGRCETYDHVVLCTQAKDAIRLVQPINPTVASLLAAIPYEASDVILHNDTQLMPKDRAQWSPMNVYSSPSGSMVTCWVNRLQPTIGTHPLVLQTWNPLLPVDPAKVMSRSHFERPIVTLKSQAAVEQLCSHQGAHNMWLCGAYSLPGIPLLDNACHSGLSVAEAIGCRPRPWTKSSRAAVPHMLSSIWAILGTIFLVITACLLSVLATVGIVVA